MDGDRICWDCSPAHVENCDDCFGWGFSPSGVPLTAASAARPVAQGWVACSMCGGRPEYVSAPREAG